MGARELMPNTQRQQWNDLMTLARPQVEYFFEEDCPDCELFRIDAITGEILLVRPLIDEKDTYTLEVNARDGDSTMLPSQRNEAPSTYTHVSMHCKRKKCQEKNKKPI